MRSIKNYSAMTMLKVFVLFACLATGAFVAACSSDSDELQGFENEEQRVEAMKAKVLKLAEMYGLKVKLTEQFDRQCRHNHVNIDSLELEFLMMSKIKGYYTFPILVRENSLLFNTESGKSLYNNKMSKATVTPREYRDYSGSYPDSYFVGHSLSVSYTITWDYSDKERTGHVYLSEVRLNNPAYAMNYGNFTYNFTGPVPNFTYSFDVKIYSNKGLEYSFTVLGTNTENHNAPKAKQKNDTITSITRFNDVTIR